MQLQQFNLTSVICLRTNKWLTLSVWSRDGNLTSTIISGQSGHGSNGNKGVHLIPQINSITEDSLADKSVSYPGLSLEGVDPLQGYSQYILQPQMVGLRYV